METDYQKRERLAAELKAETTVAIAAALGDGFTTDGDEITETATGLRFNIRTGYGLNGRWEIALTATKRAEGGWIYPSDAVRRSDLQVPTITVAQARGVAEIAKDVARRFLPQARPVWAKMQEIAQSLDDGSRKQREAISELAKRVGEPLRTTGGADPATAPTENLNVYKHGTFRGSTDGKIYFEGHTLCLTVDQAARLFAILAEN